MGDIPADSFGTVCKHLCSVWSDRIDLHLCSCQVVWPQPSEHFAVDITHFLVFRSQGPTAVFVRQVTLSNRNPTRVDFCACAVASMNRDSTLQQLSKEPRRRGELLDIEAAEAESVCGSHGTEERITYEWGNTATHFGDDTSLMQAMGSFASMVGHARFEYAVENQCSIHPIADYTRQNSIKKDVLRQWFRGFIHGVNEDSICLALWKVEMSNAVTLSCKYILLDDSNWSRQFRSIWRSDLGSSTPEIAMVEPQPPSISNAEDKQKHVIAIEHNRMPADQVVHLYDIWWTDDPHIEFLARRAVRTRRSLSVCQIAEVLGLVNSQKEQHFYALHRLEGGQSMFKFQDHQVLSVPDFSHVDFVIHEQSPPCESSLDEQGPVETGVTYVSSSVGERSQSNRAGENTATPVYDDELTGLMQTTAQIEATICFEPIRTPIQLSRRGDPSWKLWNHFAGDRVRVWPQLDEMSVWVLAEGLFVQSIPLTLFSSRPGSTTTNDPMYLWEQLGGKSIPIVLMVYPNPDPVVMPYEHLIFLPLLAHDENQRAFVVDLVHQPEPSKSPMERVAIRGSQLTPRKVASMLGYACQGCRTACTARRGLPTFVDDQEIRYPTGSYIILFLLQPVQSKTQERTHQVQAQPPRCEEGDETGFYQFVPPPRQGSHGDSERFFWVRNTVVYQPALLNTALRVGILTHLHWPLVVVHLHNRPTEVRTFGFEAHEQVSSDDMRTRFRELYADQFRTDKIVSIGPVGLDLLQHQRVNIHTIHMIAFRGRIGLSSRPILLWVRFREENQI